MAGMFYSLTEAAERLGKSEDEVRELVKEGKLREFRDGSNLLFKMQEVNALLAEDIDMGGEDELELEELSETTEQPAEASEEEEALELDTSDEESAALLGDDDESVGLSDEEEASLAKAGESAEEDDSFDDILGLEEEEGAEAGATEELSLEEEETPEPAEEPQAEEELTLEEPEAPAPEAEVEQEEKVTLEEEETVEPVAEAEEAADLNVEEEETPNLEPTGAADATSELGLAPVGEEETTEETTEGEEDFLMLDEEEEQQPAASSDAGTSEEISLAPESGILASDSDITDMDTALAGEGVNVLGDSDADLGMTDDSMAETATPAGTGTEASLEEIEDDVNLDSFGSGSGLLDLSLQADDTSLGGILDEIYTAEGGEEEAGGEGAAFDDITAEAESAPADGDEDLAVPEPVAVAPMAVAPGYAEAAPDTQSNILGMLLFLPLLALLYTAIVTVAGMNGVVPSILESIQGMVWYIVGGAIVLALIVSGASFVAGGEKTPKAAKPKKEKKAKGKAEKPKKEKAPKAKKEKPAKKKKKGLFGKKKG